MSFTKTLPTRPGDYKHRLGTNNVRWLVEVIRDEKGQLFGRISNHLSWHPVSEFEGEWEGPLVPVEQMNKEVESAYREGHMDGRCGAIPMAEVANEDYARSRARRVVEGGERV